MRYRLPRLAAGLLLTLALGACSALPAPKASPLDSYTLNPAAEIATQKPSGLTLLLSRPDAGPGFDTPRMAYREQIHELAYFARHRWVASPARMLAPLLTAVLEQSGRFKAVVEAPTAASAQLRLDCTLSALYQDFTRKPSREVVELRLQLIDLRDGRVLASRNFSATVTADADTPYGGVKAANQALTGLLPKIAAFVAEYTPAQ